MARSLRAQRLETRTARLKLPVAGKPVWAKVGHGISIGYRRNAGAGSWSIRVANGRGSHWVQKLGVADDYEDTASGRTLDFWMARDRAREIGLGARNVGDDGSDGKLATVAQAIDAYEVDLKARGGDTGNADRVRRHLPETLKDKTVALLTARDFKPWRAALTRAKLSAATINRINTAIKAAVNLAADHDERITNHRAWETALVSIPDAGEARNVILPEPVIRAVIAAANEVSPEFGLLVELAAVTGARVSQLTRLVVGDLQGDRARVMMPSSRKGKGQKKIAHRPVPIPESLVIKLRHAAKHRSGHDPLLVKPSGEGWQKSDHTRLFQRAALAAKLDPGEVTLNALRHSSIVRALLAGVPIRVVAVNHDTSVAMIEKTYSKYIADHADALARNALLDLAAPLPAGNVVPLRGT